jgi:hypothetical protein
MMSSMMWARLVLSPATLHSVSSVASCCRVAWHYSHTIAACLDALQALNALPAGMSCRHYQTSWKLARVRWKHACLAAQPGLPGFSLSLRPAAHREPRDTWQYRSPPQRGDEVLSLRTRDNVGSHLSWKARSRVIEHMTASEPTSVGR